LKVPDRDNDHNFGASSNAGTSIKLISKSIGSSRRNLDLQIFENTRSVYLDMQSSPASRNLSLVQSGITSRKSSFHLLLEGAKDEDSHQIDGNKLIEHQISEDQLDIQYRQALKSARFIMIIVSVAVIFACPLTILINFKVIGLTMYDDEKLTAFAIAGAVSASFGRFFCGYVIDKMGLTDCIRLFCLFFWCTCGVFYCFREDLSIFYICYAVFYLGFGYYVTLFPMTGVAVYGLRQGAKLQAALG
jgi:hypothetical protein